MHVIRTARLSSRAVRPALSPSALYSAASPVRTAALSNPTLSSSSSSSSLSQITSSSIAPNRPASTRLLHTTVRRSEAQEGEPERAPTSGEQDIMDILTPLFQPAMLKVQDVSGGCGSFYSIQIASTKFKGISTIKAHRQVNDALKNIIKDIHGLQLTTMAVTE